MTTQMIFSQVPSYVPSSGLVGYWGFNGNANDQSGNSNNGIVNGATLTTDRFGNANSAYNFIQGNDINIPNSSSINNLTRASVNLWFKTNTTTNSQLFKKGNSLTTSSGEQISIQLNFNSVNNNGFSTKYNSSCVPGNGWVDNFNNTISLNNNLWHMLTAVIESNSLKYYIDGVLVSSILAPNVNMDICNGGGISLGKNWNNDLDFYNGIMDDVGFWNRALSQQEITNMYNGVNYSDTCNSVSGSLVNGLVAYYPFCGNSNDQSGNGLNGTVNGATLTTDRFGNNNSAYNFNGVDNSIIVPDNVLLRPANISISCWVQSPQLTTANCVISKTQVGTATGEQYIIGYDLNGKANFQIKRNSSCVAGSNWQYLYTNNNAITNDVWQHLVCTYDGTTMKFYKNGILIQSYLPTAGSIDNCPGGTLNIGRYWQNQYHFNGKIDDIGIWNRALTQQEITDLYNQNQCATNVTVTDTLIINVGQLSYTNPVNYANNITIYPNPANTQVNISFNNITDLTGGNINIINSLGQQVATTPITLSGTTTTMQLNAWGGTGLYFVQILNAQGIVVDVKKIILQ